MLTVFGAGAQARAHVDAVISVRPIETLFIVNRTRSNGEKLAAYASSAHSASGLKRVVVLEAPDQECVRDAQIICTTTNSSKPLFDGKWLNQERGTHVNAVGSYTPAMQEIDVETGGDAWWSSTRSTRWHVEISPRQEEREVSRRRLTE